MIQNLLFHSTKLSLNTIDSFKKEKTVLLVQEEKKKIKN